MELREQNMARIEDTTKKCFICGIEEIEFSRQLDREAFKRHIKKDQNQWSYVYFMVHIWEQDKDDDDGLEYTVRKMLDANDLSWFPINKVRRK